MRVTLVLILHLGLLFQIWAQNPFSNILPPIGIIQGGVFDNNSLPLAFASVKLYVNSKEVAETLSDFDGNFYFAPVLEANYKIEVRSPFNCSGLKISKTIFVRRGEVSSETFLFGTQELISGIVRDDLGEAVPFANVTLLQNGDQVVGTTTDFDGNYLFENVKTGKYDLKFSFVGYTTKTVREIEILTGNIVSLSISINEAIDIPCCCSSHIYKPLLEKDQTTSGHTFKRNEIRRMANF